MEYSNFLAGNYKQARNIVLLAGDLATGYGRESVGVDNKGVSSSNKSSSR